MAILVPIFGCFWHFLHENLKFRHEVGLKIKNATGKCCSEWPIEHENAKKGPCRAETKKDTKSFVKHKMSVTMN